MIVKRLHTKSKIFFPDPYMVRVEFPTESMDASAATYRKVINSAYRLLSGTWGYSQLEHEMWQTKSSSDQPTPLLTSAQMMSSLFDNDFISVLRGYICFANSEDALQFRLSIPVKAVQVYMWPKREFTIHEVAEVDDS